LSDFRFGVLAKVPRSGKAWCEFARRVEGLGYSTLHLPDHLGRQFAPFPALTAAAQATTRLRVGTLVVNTDLRHPALLAREALTLDVISNGRFEFGLGCGWKVSDYTESGIPWDHGKVRVDRFEEALEVVGRMQGTERFTFKGSEYQVQDMWPGPASVQHPIPYLIGAARPRMLRLAARRAQIVSISAGGRDAAAMARDATIGSTVVKVANIHYAAPAGFMPELHVLITLMGEMEAARAFAQERGVSLADAIDTPQHLIGGSIDDMAERLLVCRERLGITYISVREQHVDEFADVMAKVSA
jgi:probable F420-dependent oxidoreductase